MDSYFTKWPTQDAVTFSMSITYGTLSLACEHANHRTECAVSTVGYYALIDLISTLLLSHFVPCGSLFHERDGNQLDVYMPFVK